MKKNILYFIIALVLAGCSSKPSNNEIKNVLFDDDTSEIMTYYDFERLDGYKENETTYIADVQYSVKFKLGTKEIDNILNQKTSNNNNSTEETAKKEALGTLKFLLSLSFGDFKKGSEYIVQEKVTLIKKDSGWTIFSNNVESIKHKPTKEEKSKAEHEVEVSKNNAQPPSPLEEVPRNLADRINAVKKQIQLEPANAAAWTELGNLYFDAGQPGKAITYYERALTLNPHQPDVLADKGIMFREIGQFDQALVCFDQALAINAGHVIAAYNKSIVLSHDKNDKAGALAAIKALALKNPNAKLPNGRTVTEAIQQLSTGK